MARALHAHQSACMFFLIILSGRDDLEAVVYCMLEMECPNLRLPWNRDLTTNSEAKAGWSTRQLQAMSVKKHTAWQAACDQVCSSNRRLQSCSSHASSRAGSAHTKMFSKDLEGLAHTGVHTPLKKRVRVPAPFHQDVSVCHHNLIRY